MAASDRRPAPRRLAGLALVASLALVACGAVAPAPRSHGSFAWLRAAPPPRGWRVLHPRGSAYRLPLPPGFRAMQADAGAASAGVSRARVVVDYLNATPRQGAETPATWARFRVAHNREEGDRAITTVAAATALPFPAGRGACVEDAYSTISHRYHELACLVHGAHASTVVVAASLERRWAKDRAVLQRALVAFTT